MKFKKLLNNSLFYYECKIAPINYVYQQPSAPTTTSATRLCFYNKTSTCQPTRRCKRTIFWAIFYLTTLAIFATLALAFSDNKHDNEIIAASSMMILSKIILYANNNKNLIPQWRQNDPNSKLILLWTPYFRDPNWNQLLTANNGPIVTTRQNSDTKCYLTTDRSLMQQASSVVFHGRDIDPEHDLPQSPRSLAQKWVFYLLESPINSMLNPDNKESTAWIRALPPFNWTMSYNSRVTDVHMPIVKFNKKSTINETEEIDARIRGFTASFRKRKYDALWIVSNCGFTQSRREHLVDHLRTLYGLNVNIVGKCSHNAMNWSDIWRQDFAANHRFYFAFENSLCEEYMTEKAFNAYNASRHFGLIPVMMGAGADGYRRMLPNNSFIHVDDFDEMSQFADFLHRVGHKAEPAELAKYFSWQYNYELDDKDNHVVAGFRQLCHQLWGGSAEIDDRERYPKSDDFHMSLGQCAASRWFGHFGPFRWKQL